MSPNSFRLPPDRIRSLILVFGNNININNIRLIILIQANLDILIKSILLKLLLNIIKAEQTNINSIGCPISDDSSIVESRLESQFWLDS